MSSVDLNNLSIEDLKKIKKDKRSKLKEEFNEYKQQQEKQKLIDEIIGVEKQRKNKILAANRIFMSSFLCFVFLWPSGTGKWVLGRSQL